MEEKKGISWLQFLKWTIIFYLAWIVISIGWEGWYIWSRGKKVIDVDLKERFGTNVFKYWLGINLLALISLLFFNLDDNLIIMCLVIMWSNATFLALTGVGFFASMFLK